MDQKSLAETKPKCKTERKEKERKRERKRRERIQTPCADLMRIKESVKDILIHKEAPEISYNFTLICSIGVYLSSRESK